MFEGLKQSSVRAGIFWVYMPRRRLTSALRGLGRSVRTALGMRPSRRAGGALRIPSQPWYRVCRASGTVFREIDKVDGNVNLAELAVLNALCRTYRPETILEIGTFDGRTTLNLALNSDARIFTLDLPPDQETVYDLRDRNQRYIQKEASGTRFSRPPNDRLPGVERITQLYGDSASFDFSPWYGKIDFVFVDGAHTYDYVVHDTRTALRLLKPEGGVIVWHDYGGGWPGVAQALHELRERMPSLPMVHVQGTSLVVSVSRGEHRVYAERSHTP